MAKKPSERALQSALTDERRKNRRLRLILEDMRKQIDKNHRELEVQFTRLAQMQAAIDGLSARIDRRT